jgi:hemoglobin-like flavoprotein
VPHIAKVLLESMIESAPEVEENMTPAERAIGDQAKAEVLSLVDRYDLDLDDEEIIRAIIAGILITHANGEAMGLSWALCRHINEIRKGITTHVHG